MKLVFQFLFVFFFFFGVLFAQDPWQDLFDPGNEGYTQELFSVWGNALRLGGAAFLNNGDLAIAECSDASKEIYIIDTQTTATVMGSTVYPLKRVHVITEDATVGCDLLNHPDGNIYTNSYDGIFGFSADDLSLTVVGGGSKQTGFLGLSAHPRTGVIYRHLFEGISSYNPSTGVHNDSFFFGEDIDGLAWNKAGSFLYAARPNEEGVFEIREDGTLNRYIEVPGGPDGISFGVSSGTVWTNNIDGSISRFNPSLPNPIVTKFADGGNRGDLGVVGPDGCWYVSQEGAFTGQGRRPYLAAYARICGPEPFYIPPGTPAQICPKAWEAKVDGKSYPLEAFEIDNDDIATYYSYGVPVGSSSNSGLEQDNKDKALIILVRDASGNNHLVVIYDKPNDVPNASGGSANSRVEHDGDLDGATFGVKDDPPETYLTGAGFFATSHQWLTCCTDGYTIGPIPDFACFNVTIQATTNIRSVRLASAAFQDGTATEIEKTDDGFITVEICNVQDCTALSPPCSKFDTCRVEYEFEDFPDENRTSITNFGLNLISFGDFTAESGDVEGRLAVRNNVVITDGFSIADKINSSKNDLSYPFSVLVGRNMTWKSGRVYPDELSNTGKTEYIFVGDHFSTEQQFGIADRVVANCSTRGGSGCLDNFFDEMEACYSVLSQGYCAKGETNIRLKHFNYTGLFVECEDSTAQLNVLHLDWTDFENVNWYSVSNCLIDAEWIINVKVDSGVDFDISGDVFPGVAGTITWNFCPSFAVNDGCDGSVKLGNAFNGNVLAPHTVVRQNSGVIYGRVVACSFEGEGQVQINRPCLNPLPIRIRGIVSNFNIPLKRDIETSLIPVASYSNLVAGDVIEFGKSGNKYTIWAREEIDGQKFFRVTPPASIVDAQEGQYFESTVALNVPRYNLNRNINETVPDPTTELPSDAPTDEPIDNDKESGASTLLFGLLTILFATLFA